MSNAQDINLADLDRFDFLHADDMPKPEWTVLYRSKGPAWRVLAIPGRSLVAATYYVGICSRVWQLYDTRNECTVPVRVRTELEAREFLIMEAEGLITRDGRVPLA